MSLGTYIVYDSFEKINYEQDLTKLDLISILSMSAMIWVFLNSFVIKISKSKSCVSSNNILSGIADVK